MKRNILYLMAAVLIFSGCKKESLKKYEIEKSYADPSLKLEDFKKAINSAPEGFRLIMTPSSGGLVGGYIKFDGTGNAKLLLDNTVANATTAKDNFYSMKISKTNSVLSLGDVSPFAIIAKAIGGVDTVYSYRNTVGDTLKLVGDQFGAKLSLIKVSKKDGDEYLAGKMGQTITAINGLKSFAKYFKRLTIGGKSYDISLNTSSKMATFNYAVGTTFTTFTTPMIFINSGVEFTNPLVDGANTIRSLNDLVVNAATSSVTLTSGGNSATITNEIAPVIIDKTLGATFLQVPDKQWISTKGFTRDGVEDYLNLASITGFSRLIYWVKYEADYDLVGFTFGNSVRYGPAVIPTVSANGTIVFGLYGVLGTLPASSSPDRTKVVTTINNITHPSGFYIVKTGATSYDFVSVNNGNTWITFQ